MFLKTFFKILKILRNKMSLLPQILKSIFQESIRRFNFFA